MTFRSALLSCAACAACATLPVALAGGQLPGPVPREKEPPSQQTRMQEQRLPLAVYGCIRGKRFVLSSMSDREGIISLLNANELQLEGPKELLTQLRREHENHDDELTGIAIVPPSPDGSSTSEGQTKELGKKARVTLGVRESSGPTGNVRRTVRFRVEAVRHLQDACTVF
jgi:hypothetical protein